MKGGKQNSLNFEADTHPGNPTAVSDPKCWITGRNAELIQEELINRIGMLRSAPSFRISGVLDISEDVEIEADGRLRQKNDTAGN